MTTFTLTVEQIKEIFEAGKNSDQEIFPYESLIHVMQSYINEGISVHSKQYLHTSDIFEIMEL